MNGTRAVGYSDNRHRHAGVVTREIGPLETRIGEGNLVAGLENQRQSVAT